jgi:hypothetical protein
MRPDRLGVVAEIFSADIGREIQVVALWEVKMGALLQPMALLLIQGILSSKKTFIIFRRLQLGNVYEKSLEIPEDVFTPEERGMLIKKFA